MAEGRMIKKVIANSKKLALCGDRARVIYFMMLPHTDIEGRIKACPPIVKGQYLTMLKYTELVIQKALDELHDVGLIVLYESDGNQYAEYTRFSDFQTLNPSREAESKISAPTQDNSRVVERTLYKDKLSLSKDKLSKDNEYSQNSDEFRLASVLYGLILKRKPDYKKPDLQEWAKHIDRMIRIDKRMPEAIERVIGWCQRDDFWQNNILSTAKLRKQFDQLELKSQGNANGNNRSRNPSLNEQDWGDEELIES